MTEITIKKREDDKIELRLNGNGEELIKMIANAILNDPNFGMLVIAAMAHIAEQGKSFPDINLN